MSKTDLLERVGYDKVLSVTQLNDIDFELYDDRLFDIYWFLRVNKLIEEIIMPREILLLEQNGFFQSRALMRSIRALSQREMRMLMSDHTPLDIAVERLNDLPGFSSDNYNTLITSDRQNWFSLQWGINSIVLPMYLWTLVPEIVANLVGDLKFFIDVTDSNGVPVIQLSFGKYAFSRVKQVLEFNMPNTDDPVLECAESFLEMGFINDRNFSYVDKVTVIFPIVHLYEFDSAWRYAFVSPIRDRIVHAYEPGDYFFDALWKCLQEDVSWMLKPAEHIHQNIVEVFGVKYDLIKYVTDPERFVTMAKGGMM